MSNNIMKIYGNNQYKCEWCGDALAVIKVRKVILEIFKTTELLENYSTCEECAIEQMDLSKCPDCNEFFDRNESWLTITPYYKDYFRGNKYTELSCEGCDAKYEKNYDKTENELYEEVYGYENEVRKTWIRNCL